MVEGGGGGGFVDDWCDDDDKLGSVMSFGFKWLVLIGRIINWEGWFLGYLFGFLVCC